MLAHDPHRQTGWLKQILTLDKAFLGFFLAGGCPASIRIGTEPLIPDIAGLTNLLVGELLAGSEKESFGKLSRQFTEDKKNNPNVEDILSRVRALKQVVGTGEVRGLTYAELDRLESTVCKIITHLVDKSLPNKASPFHKLATWVISAVRLNAVEIFTTNYDLLIEQALEDIGVPYFDGYVGAREAFFDLPSIEHDVLPPRWARLWKLHGSINWRATPDGRVLRGSLPTDGEQILVHPSHLKYDQSRRMPYLAMIDRLRSFLSRKSAFLIVCGYSFGDEHLNEVLAEGLRGNPTATVFALQFAPLEDYKSGVDIATKSSNLILLARDAAVIGTSLAPWQSKKTADADPADPFVSWDEDAKNAGTYVGKLLLGDFVQFGQFLTEVMGDRPLIPQLPPS